MKIPIRKQMANKWSLAAAKVSLAAAVLVVLGVVAYADGEDSRDFGSHVEKVLRSRSMHWFGVQGPLDASAPATTGNYRTPSQSAADQVLLANSLKAEYVTRIAANAADMFAFWPSDEAPTHLIFCVESGRQDLGTFLPGGVVRKFNPSVQSVRLSDGSV
ncbi:MAG: hypothetical protein NNA23_11300, partial [Nitrospira sp.]|nr:hypothetical protein [Nitrospira sp.]